MDLLKKSLKFAVVAALFSLTTFLFSQSTVFKFADLQNKIKVDNSLDFPRDI